jgi:hypothetical protein
MLAKSLDLITTKSYLSLARKTYMSEESWYGPKEGNTKFWCVVEMPSKSPPDKKQTTCSLVINGFC